MDDKTGQADAAQTGCDGHITALHLAVCLADVPDHDRRDGCHDDKRDNGTSPAISTAAEHPVEHEIGKEPWCSTDRWSWSEQYRTP